MHNIHVCMYMHVSFIMMFTTFSRNSGNRGWNRGCAFTSFPLSVIENKQKYMEAGAILSGKNVQRVTVGNSISCRLSVLLR